MISSAKEEAEPPFDFKSLSEKHQLQWHLSKYPVIVFPDEQLENENVTPFIICEDDLFKKPKPKQVKKALVED